MYVLLFCRYILCSRLLEITARTVRSGINHRYACFCNLNILCAMFSIYDTQHDYYGIYGTFSPWICLKPQFSACFLNNLYPHNLIQCVYNCYIFRMCFTFFGAGIAIDANTGHEYLPFFTLTSLYLQDPHVRTCALSSLPSRKHRVKTRVCRSCHPSNEPKHCVQHGACDSPEIPSVYIIECMYFMGGGGLRQ